MEHIFFIIGIISSTCLVFFIFTRIFEWAITRTSISQVNKETDKVYNLLLKRTYCTNLELTTNLGNIKKLLDVLEERYNVVIETMNNRKLKG